MKKKVSCKAAAAAMLIFFSFFYIIKKLYTFRNIFGIYLRRLSYDRAIPIMNINALCHFFTNKNTRNIKVIVLLFIYHSHHKLCKKTMAVCIFLLTGHLKEIKSYC